MRGVLALTGGEVDVRGCYTAMAVAHMLCLDKAALSRSAGMVDFVRRCQVEPPSRADSFVLSCIA